MLLSVTLDGGSCCVTEELGSAAGSAVLTAPRRDPRYALNNNVWMMENS